VDNGMIIVLKQELKKTADDEKKHRITGKIKKKPYGNGLLFYSH
jgi:hypothetical protein